MSIIEGRICEFLIICNLEIIREHSLNLGWILEKGKNGYVARDQLLYAL